MKIIDLNITIPWQIWVIGAVGILGIVIGSIMLLREVNQPLTFQPKANPRLSINEPYYTTLLTLADRPPDAVYKVCLAKYQSLLISKHLPKIWLGCGLIVIPIAYWCNQLVIVNEWEDNWLILLGFVMIPLFTSISFYTRSYSLITWDLLLAWSFFALSLSGRLLYHDTLLFFIILIWAIGFFSIFTADSERNSDKSWISWGIFSLIILFIFCVIRYLLPLIGSFTILLVIPAIAMLCNTKGIGCLASLLAIPLVITSAILEKRFFVFPNSLLVAGFFGLDLALFLNLFISPKQVIKLVKEIYQFRRLSLANYPPFPCAACGSSMEYIDSSKLNNYLNHAQKTAQSLETMAYFAWRCPQCSQASAAIHLRSYFKKNRGYSFSNSWFEDCPTCEELTMACRRTLIETSLSGFIGIKVKKKKFRVARICHACHLEDSYTTSINEIFPQE